MHTNNTKAEQEELTNKKLAIRRKHTHTHTKNHRHQTTQNKFSIENIL